MCYVVCSVGALSLLQSPTVDQWITSGVLTLLGDGLRAAICPLLPGIHETCPKEGPNGEWRGGADHIPGPVLTVRFYGQGAAALMT